MTEDNKQMIKMSGLAIIFFAIGTFGSMKSIENDFINSAAFFTLFILLIFGSLLLAFSPKIQSFKISALSLDVKLKEIKQAESNIKELAKAIYEAVDSDSGSMKYESWDGGRYKTAIENLKKFAE
jgi:hypothetical protein